MAKNRMEKIAGYEGKISKLKEQMKMEMQKQKKDERNNRTKRLCTRHGLMEKLMPDLINITDEQFEIFVKTGINTSYGKKRLAEIISVGEKAATSKPTDYAETAEDSVSANPQNPARSEA